jgi:hypothetical protein
MKARKPLCGAVHKQVGKYAVCGLDAGHKSAHWDAELRISWNARQVIEMKDVK